MSLAICTAQWNNSSMHRSGREVAFRARDLWITAATSIPLGSIVVLVMSGIGRFGDPKPRGGAGLLLLGEVGGLIGPIAALGGGIGFLLAKRRLYVRGPRLLVIMVALGSGLILWFMFLLFALTRLDAVGIVGVIRPVIALFVPAVLSGAIPAALAFGTLTWIRLRIPPPSGTELGAYRGPEGAPGPLPESGD